MKERPIIMSAPMAIATFDGSKTQTRRIVKQRNREDENQEYGVSFGSCPYGQPGDRLWIRENVRAEELKSGLDGVRYTADGHFIQIENTVRASIDWLTLHTYHGKRGASVPSIHMPRWACRSIREITAVRVERLQDISERDCWAEGCEGDDDDVTGGISGYREYRALWESINGAGSWDANPWVWVIEFKKVTP